jgi:hypothetical protein
MVHTILTKSGDHIMTILAYPKARRRAAKTTALAIPVVVAPPSGALLNAILSYADLTEDIGGGLTLLRVSARRMEDVVIAQALGREASRLADVSIIWNDEGSEIHAILDAASPTGIEDLWAEPQFELTDLAMAYLDDMLASEALAEAG